MNQGPSLSSSIYRPLEFGTGDHVLRIALILSSSEPSIVFSTSFNNLYEDLYRILISLREGGLQLGSGWTNFDVENRQIGNDKTGTNG
jgi:hypothetical protein